MIDTITLSIRRGYVVMNPELFTMDFNTLKHLTPSQLGARKSAKAVLNPRRGDLESGIYRPTITATKRIGDERIELRIQFSVAKMVYKNNIDEVQESDYTRVRDALLYSLRGLGILISSQILDEAEVVVLHYSKNVLLPDGIYICDCLDDIARSGLSRRPDIRKTEYDNGGAAFRIHYNESEVIFYDKLAEYDQAKKSI